MIPPPATELARSYLHTGAGFLELSKDAALAHVLPDTDEWHEIKIRQEACGEPWTDPTFPPDDRALYQDPQQPADFAQHVHGWARVGDIFHRSHALRFTFSEQADTKCCGFNSKADPEQHIESTFLEEGNAVFIQGALAAAKALAQAGFSNSGDARMAAVTQLAGSMAESLTASDFFHKVETLYEPLHFLEVEDSQTFVVGRNVEPGYVPLIEVQVTLLFAPLGGQLNLFDSAKGGEDVAKAGDVFQGVLGDCYLLGAVSMISCVPGQIARVFPTDNYGVQEYNSEGIYAVRFWRDGSWRVVVVDDWIPVNKEGKPVFAQLSHTDCEFWVLILEKAYAKLNGCYEAIESGHENIALQDLTGGVPFTFKFDALKEEWTGTTGKDRFWEYLQDRMRDGSHCGVSKSQDKEGRSSQIVCHHAYGIIRFGSLNGRRIVQVRNPWGAGKEWDGELSDADPAWEEVSDADKRRLGYSVEEDGTWWMPFDDLLSNFDTMSMCRIMDDYRQAHSVTGQWRGITASGANNPQLSPQFHLHLQEDSSVVVELRQPSNRMTHIGYEAIAPIMAANADRHGNVFLEPRVGHSVFNHGRSSVIEVDLSASDGPFSISPVCFKEGFESIFTLCVYTSGPSRLTACDDADVPVDPVTGERLKGRILCFENDGSKVFVQAENVGAYMAKTAPKCGHCGGPVAAMEGQFDGRYYTTDDGKVHAECYDEYKIAHAPICDHCGGPVAAIEGKFDGRYYTTDDGKVHTECYDEYLIAKAPKCEHCGEPVIAIEGHFNGSYYSTDGEGKVHVECFDEYCQSK